MIELRRHITKPVALIRPASKFELARYESKNQKYGCKGEQELFIRQVNQLFTNKDATQNTFSNMQFFINS